MESPVKYFRDSQRASAPKGMDERQQLEYQISRYDVIAHILTGELDAARHHLDDLRRQLRCLPPEKAMSVEELDKLLPEQLDKLNRDFKSYPYTERGNYGDEAVQARRGA